MSDDDDFMDALPIPMITEPFTGIFGSDFPEQAAQVHPVEQRGGIDMVDVAPPIQTQSTPATPPIDPPTGNMEVRMTLRRMPPGGLRTFTIPSRAAPPVDPTTNTDDVLGAPLANSSITATAGSDASIVTI